MAPDLCTSNSEIRGRSLDQSASAAWRFVLKGVGLLIGFYVAALSANFVFSKLVDWRALQDPRQRILWDDITPESGIIILGDSVFISGHADTETQTLGAVLSRDVGAPVFNGALNGADPPDFLKAAQLVAQRPGRGRTVILDIIPTRPLEDRVPAGPGNYPTEFRRRVADDALSWVGVSLLRPLHIMDPTVLMNCLKRKKYFGSGEYRNTVWWNDGGQAIAKFRTFEKYWIPGGGLKPFGWIREMAGILEGAGYRFVLVLTPVNEPLIRRYATQIDADECVARFAHGHSELLKYLSAERIAYVDASGKLSSNEFADLVHPNTEGDQRLADLIAGYLDDQNAAVSRRNAKEEGRLGISALRTF